jgi:putative tryptophan/tyrosine transport system substrate-binding protein
MPFDQLKRRKFITLLGGAAAAWPLASRAQTPPKMLRVGVVSLANPRTTTFWVAFDRRMRELGYVEGQNLTIDFVNLNGQIERYGEATKEVVRRKADIIIATGPERGLTSAIAATDTLPIVMIAVDYDPFARGYVQSLARPGGRVTGVFFQQIELAVKRLQLMKEALPDVAAATVFWNATSADQWRATQSAAETLGLKLSGVELGNPPYDYEKALAAQAPADHRRILMVLSSPVFFPDRERLAQIALRHRIASMFVFRGYVDAGGLLSYGPSIDALYQRAAEYVDRIAKGTNPADLPVEQPTKFELIVNLKTAKAIGIELPTSILLRADEVIE